MILIIDNFDSFTYNLVQYLGDMGQKLRVVRNDEVSISDIAAIAPQKIMISPGPCTPDEAGISIDVIKKFMGKIPILGVCLGHQCIARALDGNVVRADRLMHGKTSPIIHDGKGIFEGLPSPFDATRYHSLIIEKSTFPQDLEISAWTKEGEIMGVRHKKFALEGVQFHPESILTGENGKQLLRNFVEKR